MERRETNINPDMLSWARELAGLSVDSAAKKIGFRDSKSNTAIDKLISLETGANFPTWRQFHRIAKVYHQSPTVFFMEKPPMDDAYVDELLNNHLNAQDISSEEKGLLIALSNNISERQHIVRSVVEDDKNNSFQKLAGPKLRISDFRSDKKVKTLVKTIRGLLEFPAEQNMRNSFGSTFEIFDDLRTRIEQIGVFVLVCGDLGTYHTKLSESVFKGFAIVDNLAPFIVINENGTIQSRVFTLMHEFAHVLIGKMNDSKTLHFLYNASKKSAIEIFCDRVASEFFIPLSLQEEIGRAKSASELSKKVENLALELKLPVHLIMHILLQNECIDMEFHDTIIGKFRNNPKLNCFIDKKRYHETKPSSVSFAAKRQRLGNALINRVKEAFKAKDLTRLKAAQILDVNPSFVGRLLNAD